jgi:hypothetical protein
MPTRTPRKAAPAAKKAATAPKKAAVVKDDKPKRAVAAALLDRKSAEFKSISERYQNWIIQWQDNGVADVINKALKGKLHRIMGHNHGLFIVSTTEDMYAIGTLSATGKSFTVDFESDTQEEAWENYRANRSGSYGADAKPAEKPAPKTKAAAKKAPAKAAPAKARRAPRKAAASDDLLD